MAAECLFSCKVFPAISVLFLAVTMNPSVKQRMLYDLGHIAYIPVCMQTEAGYAHIVGRIGHLSTCVIRAGLLSFAIGTAPFQG